MRQPRVRFTVRRMMVAVAIVGVLLWTTLRLGKRARAYRRMAEYHAARKSLYPAPWLMRTDLPMLVNSAGEMISIGRDDWHAALEAKYLRAARLPWLPVEPDPPEPK